MLDRASDPRGPVSPRQPIFNVPSPVLLVLTILVGIHLIRQVIPDAWDDALFAHLAFVPGRVTFAIAPQHVIDTLIALAGQGQAGYREAQADRFFLGDGSAQPWTAFTYALLHGSWAHIGLNSVWLLAFGTPVARRFGLVRFLLFFAVTAVAGAAAQYIATPFDLGPVIGASASVSGFMGAALRFMFQPDVPVIMALEAAPSRLPPAQPLRFVFTDRRAVIFLVAWFATNLLFGLGSLGFGLASEPIAWQAHIGGFLAGLLLFRLFDPPPPPEPALDPDAAPLAPDEPTSGICRSFARRTQTTMSGTASLRGIRPMWTHRQASRRWCFAAAILAAEVPAGLAGPLPLDPQARAAASCGPGALALPGSKTCLRIGGFVRAEASVASSPAPAVPGIVPAGRPHRTAGSSLRPEARIDAEARSETPSGPIRAYVSVKAR